MRTTTWKTIRRTALVLALALLIIAPGAMPNGAAAEQQAEDPPVITVGAVSYPVSEVQFAVTAAMDAAMVLEDSMDGEERQELVDMTTQRLVGMAVIENKLMEKGWYDFTEDEQETLRAYAREQYEQTWQSFLEMMAEEDPEITEATCTEFLNSQGYTADAFYREILMSEREMRILSLFCAEVTVTPEETWQFYLENYVNPDREKYAHDVARYEEEILLKGNEAFYVPEGYRYIKHILLSWPEEMVEEMKPYARQVNRAQETLQKAYQALADAAVAAESWEELQPAKTAYNEAKGAYETEKAAFLEKRNDVLPLVRETTDEIDRKLREGAAFEDLMAEYSVDESMQSPDDAGFPFHPDSPNWPEEFRAAAAALETPGDVSAPVVTDTGIHIIRYMSDCPGGIHQLTEEELKALEASALLSAQRAKLTELIAEWLPEYETEIHPELLKAE